MPSDRPGREPSSRLSVSGRWLRRSSRQGPLAPCAPGTSCHWCVGHGSAKARSRAPHSCAGPLLRLRSPACLGRRCC
eukprot:6098882-Alexandrium_andersonii.AAC.1